METKQVVRTVPARDTNGSIYWKKIVKERTVFTDEDRTGIVAEYQAGKMTAAEIVKKYRLSSKQVLFSWMDRYLREGLRHNDRACREQVQHTHQKKIWHQTVGLLRSRLPGASLDALCGLFGYSRQAFYKRGDHDFADDAVEGIVIEAARELRRDNPGIGCTKLHRMISDSLGDCGGMPGRDTFIELLRQNDLMVRMRRRKHYRTTYSEHSYRKYPNLVKGVIPTRPNQIWVADITYVETDEGCQYCSYEYVNELRKQ